MASQNFLPRTKQHLKWCVDRPQPSSCWVKASMINSQDEPFQVRESPRQILGERDAQWKLRQKEYAYRRRSAQYSDIGEGDHILLNKTPNFEPLGYKVVEKKGNAVLIQDQKGNTKLRHASHTKKSLLPDPATEVHEGDEAADTPKEDN